MVFKYFPARDYQWALCHPVSRIDPVGYLIWSSLSNVLDSDWTPRVNTLKQNESVNLLSPFSFLLVPIKFFSTTKYVNGWQLDTSLSHGWIRWQKSPFTEWQEGLYNDSTTNFFPLVRWIIQPRTLIGYPKSIFMGAYSQKHLWNRKQKDATFEIRFIFLERYT